MGGFDLLRFGQLQQDADFQLRVGRVQGNLAGDPAFLAIQLLLLFGVLKERSRAGNEVARGAFAVRDVHTGDRIVADPNLPPGIGDVNALGLLLDPLQKVHDPVEQVGFDGHKAEQIARRFIEDRGRGEQVDFLNQRGFRVGLPADRQQNVAGRTQERLFQEFPDRQIVPAGSRARAGHTRYP